MVRFSLKFLDFLGVFLPFIENNAKFLRFVAFDGYIKLINFTYLESA